MNRLKNVVRDQALNEDAMLTRIRSSHTTLKREDKFMPMKRLLPLGLAAALVLAVIASWSFFTPGVTAPVTTGTAAEKPAISAYAMVAIDINPSFEIYIDTEENDYKVLAIHATNKDAKALYEENIDLFNGLIEDGDKDKAVKAIIDLARDNGFLSEDSSVKEEGKYVLVTTAILDADEDGEEDDEEELDSEDLEESERNQESIGYQIQQALLAAPEGSVKVAVIKATLRDVKFAEKEKIPLGMYIIKGMVNLNGDERIDDADDVNNDGNPDKISDVMKYLKEKMENDEEISAELSEMFAKRISILENKAERDALKESKASDPEGSEEESPKGKPSTPPGQEKKTEPTGTDT